MTRSADIALVLDASTSMLGATGAGRSKMAAAREAAHGFVDGMRVIDRVAIVSFHGGSALEAGLSADAAALHAAIDGIENAPGTRIDLALREATGALAPELLRPKAKGVIVLLTDGLHGGAPIAELRAAAEAARARATVFTIGVGPDVDAALLAEIAGDPARYYGVADAEALTAIYAAIRERIACERAMPEVPPIGGGS